MTYNDIKNSPNGVKCSWEFDSNALLFFAPAQDAPEGRVFIMHNYSGKDGAIPVAGSVPPKIREQYRYSWVLVERRLETVFEFSGIYNIQFPESDLLFLKTKKFEL